RGDGGVGLAGPPVYATRRLDFLHCSLITLFLLGLYLGVALPVTSKIPLTCAPVGLRRPDRAVAPARPDPSSASGRPAGGRRRLSLLDPGGLELRVPEQALHRASAAHLFAGHRLRDLSDPGSRRPSTNCRPPSAPLPP